MALMTGEQYIESIKKIKMEIYMFGEKYNNPTESPILRPSLNSVRMTYDLAQMPEYRGPDDCGFPLYRHRASTALPISIRARRIW